MNTIAVSDLRANLTQVLKEIQRSSTIDITLHGKVVTKLVPPDYYRKIAKKRLQEISKSAVLGDIISPFDTQWAVLQK